MNEMNLMQQPSKIIHRPQPKRRYFDLGIRAGSYPVQTRVDRIA